MTKSTVYNRQSTQQVNDFVESLKNNAKPSGVYDSAAAADFISESTHQGTGVKIPEHLAQIFDEAGEEGKTQVARAILDSVEAYKGLHGSDPSADVIEQAIHSAYATTDEATSRFKLDSASSDHHANLSLQPNRAVVAILSTIAEAIPFAHYLPADIRSNESRLAIMSHKAGFKSGIYDHGDLMDGSYSGDAFISSARVHKCEIDAEGKITGKLSIVQLGDELCDPDAGDVKLLRGRSIVYVNGLVAAREIDASGAGDSTVSGNITLEGVKYQISGVINTDTGVIALASTPSLPTTTPVHVEGFIDYERNSAIIPRIITAVDTYTLYANPWRVYTETTIDSRTQMASELGLDPHSEGVISINQQFANERHYNVLLKARRLAANNQHDFEFDWAAKKAHKQRWEIWSEFAGALAVASQQMAIDTMSHGISHLYVGKHIAAEMQSLPSSMFTPSGVMVRPGIFRIGRLFNLYDVYYSPKVINDSDAGGQVLCIGRANDVTRNPFVLGDAVPPLVMPTAVNADLKQGASFYARNFTSVNPHYESSRGVAMINVTGMK